MELNNDNGFVHNRSKQILSMYGYDVDGKNIPQNQELKKAEEQTVATIVEESKAEEIVKSKEEAQALEIEKEDDFNKSLANLMVPITFD